MPIGKRRSKRFKARYRVASVEVAGSGSESIVFQRGTTMQTTFRSATITAKFVQEITARDNSAKAPR
jgi:hypothetical protein